MGIIGYVMRTLPPGHSDIKAGHIPDRADIFFPS